MALIAFSKFGQVVLIRLSKLRNDIISNPVTSLRYSSAAGVSTTGHAAGSIDPGLRPWTAGVIPDSSNMKINFTNHGWDTCSALSPVAKPNSAIFYSVIN